MDSTFGTNVDSKMIRKALEMQSDYANKHYEEAASKNESLRNIFNYINNGTTN